MGSLAVRFTHIEYLYFPPQNIFLSIAVGVSLISVLEWTKKQHTIQTKVVGLLGASALAFVSIFTESSLTGLGLFAVFYLFYNRRPGLYIAYVAMCMLSVLNGLMNIEYFWTFEYQWAMIAALPLIALYNGKRGRDMRYLFYFFYPLHLWILYTIAVIWVPASFTIPLSLRSHP